MVQAANNEVTFDVLIPIDKAMAKLKADEPRLVAGVQQMAARAGKSAQIHFKAVFDEASVRKRMADMIRDMEQQAANAKIEMEARVRLFGPDGQTPLEQWVKRSVEVGSKAAWSSGKGPVVAPGPSSHEMWTRASHARATANIWSNGGGGIGATEAMVGSGGGGFGGIGAGGTGSGAGGSSLGDMFGKRSALGKSLSLLRGGGAVFALSMGLDMLGRMTGQMRTLRDEIRLGEKSAGDMATAFGKSIPVLGKIVTIGEELRELFTGENFGLARVTEVANVVNATTQQMFQMQREIGRIMAEMDRRQQDTQGEIRVLDAPTPERARVKFEVDAEKELRDFDLETKKMEGELKRPFEDMLKDPMSAANVADYNIPANVASLVRDKSLLDLQAEANKRTAEARGSVESLQKSYDTVPNNYVGAQLRTARRELNDASMLEDDINKAVEQVRAHGESAVNRVIKGVVVNDKGVATPTGEVSREEEKNNLLEWQRKRREQFDKDDKAQAERMKKFTIPAAEERAAGNFDLAERLTLQGELARKQEEADAVGKETAEQVRKENELALEAYDKRVKLAKEESKIADESRIKAAKQRLEGDFVGAEKTEREASNAAEIRAMETAGATKEEIARRIEARQAEEAALANDRQLQADLKLARSVDDVKQAQLRASERYYESEMFAIEQAYNEKIRLAEKSATKEIDIEIAKNERLAAITELEAKKAKDESARSESRSSSSKWMGSGSWLADSIYTMTGSNPLVASRKKQLTIDSPYLRGDRTAMTKSELEKNRYSSNTRTAADSKVEIQGDAITLLREISKNTANGTAVFSS